MSSFLSGWLDIEAGKYDEIEGIGKMILFPLEFFSDLLEDAKDDVRELKKSPEARLESLERRYQYEGIKSKEVKKRQAKLQKFILANKEKVKERLKQYRKDFQNRIQNRTVELAYEGIYQILESKTYGRFQSMIDENKEKDLMKPKVIQLPERAESFTPYFLRDKQKPEKRGEQDLKPEPEEPEPVKKEEPEEKRKELVLPLPEPPVIEADWKEIPDKDKPEKDKPEHEFIPEITR